MTRPALKTPAEWRYSPDPEIEGLLFHLAQKFPSRPPRNLDSTLDFLHRLGDPHLKIPPAFHVAGTNGKGSTLAFLQAILEAGELGVHKFISPHLVRFEERIIVNGKNIGGDLFLELAKICESKADGSVSFFEFLTGLAFLAFAREKAAAVLLETGLGGALDSTNVIHENIVPILTRVSMDHMHVLGSSLQDIARHKAGIIKENIPVVIAPQTDDCVMRIFLEQAAALHAPAFVFGRDWKTTGHSDHFIYESKNRRFRLPLPKLPGAHQLTNAGCAIAALEQSAFQHLLTENILAQGLQNVFWPGRLQRLEQGHLAELLPPGWELWIDGAHNDSGAEILAEHIRGWHNDKPLHLITAFKAKKDIDGFYAPLQGLADSVQTVNVPSESVMIDAVGLAAHLSQIGFDNVSAASSLPDALRTLVFQFETPRRILAAGSLYLAGNILKVNDETG